MSDFVFDQYLASQTMPPQQLAMDPQYFNITMVTPIGRFLNCDVNKPRSIRQKDGKVNDPKFAITLLMAGGTNENPIVADLYKAIAAIANAKIPSINRPNPTNPSQMVQMTGEQLLQIDPDLGGLHYPLRDGNKMWMKEPDKNVIYRGGWFINASMFPATKDGTPQEPLCFDERNMRCDPSIFYRGCYGRAMVRVAWFDTNGNKGVTFYLQGVQFARHGEKLTSFDASGAVQGAFAAAGALPVTEPAPGATGPNFGAPPPGAGFAAPATGFAQPAPPMQQPQTGFAAPPAGYIPPQQPHTPPTGARPPGV